MPKLIFLLLLYCGFYIFFDMCSMYSEPHILYIELSVSSDFLDIVPNVVEIEVKLKEVALEKAKLKEAHFVNNSILKR